MNMQHNLGLSSETYHVHPESLASLDRLNIDFSGDGLDCDAVVLLACEATQQQDKIIYLRDAQQLAHTRIRTRFAFATEGFWFNLFGAFIKKVRSRRQNFSSHSYRILLSDIIDNQLERNIKTPETAYNWTNRRWKIDEEARVARYSELRDSFQSGGYDFNHPMHIMLCRSMGVQDKLNQGHHRMMFCKMYQIDEVSTQFISSAYMPSVLQPALKKFIQLTRYKQV